MERIHGACTQKRLFSLGLLQICVIAILSTGSYLQFTAFSIVSYVPVVLFIRVSKFRNILHTEIRRISISMPFN